MTTAAPGQYSAQALPGGAQLAPGEQVLVSEQFMVSTVAFFLHQRLVLTNRRLYSMRPNTMLGLIPVGTSRNAYPIGNIAGISAATRFSLPAFLIGALALLVGWGGTSSPGMISLAIVMIVIGVLLMLGSWRQAVEVMNSGGGAVRFPVSILQRGRAVEFANRVSAALARRPNEPTETARVPDTDPATVLRGLQQLRDDGLINDDEFAQKRSEVLGRL